VAQEGATGALGPPKDSSSERSGGRNLAGRGARLVLPGRLRGVRFHTCGRRWSSGSRYLPAGTTVTGPVSLRIGLIWFLCGAGRWAWASCSGARSARHRPVPVPLPLPSQSFAVSPRRTPLKRSWLARYVLVQPCTVRCHGSRKDHSAELDACPSLISRSAWLTCIYGARGLGSKRYAPRKRASVRTCSRSLALIGEANARGCERRWGDGRLLAAYVLGGLVQGGESSQLCSSQSAAGARRWLANLVQRGAATLRVQAGL
jgi:hypothetical protein